MDSSKIGSLTDHINDDFGCAGSMFSFLEIGKIAYREEQMFAVSHRW